MIFNLPAFFPCFRVHLIYNSVFICELLQMNYGGQSACVYGLGSAGKLIRLLAVWECCMRSEEKHFLCAGLMDEAVSQGAVCVGARPGI